ncbi:unnamed protein product [Owenia fusiformis]|uniref:Uncharacterized protein n=1 Tax=Owenia fusiformis TaxID=6347 RepID=A0A8J1UE54_OWEFU|nr:unnamed protein product [Owenia fusiformis]
MLNMRKYLINLLRSQTLLLHILLLLTLTCHKVNGGFDHTCNYESQREGPVSTGMCGSNLGFIINLYCSNFGGIYGGTGNGKRSIQTIPLDNDMITTRYLNNLEPKPSFRSHFSISKRTAQTFLTKRFSKKGVVCECCYHQCRQRELRKFCKN